MQNSSQRIMVDICKEYLKVAKGKKFQYYRLFSSVPNKFYSKYQGKLSKKEIEVLFAAKRLKVKVEVVITYYGDYRTGFYRADESTHAHNAGEEIIRDLKLSKEFSNILWTRHKLQVEDLERLCDLENVEVRKKHNERANWRRKKPEQAQQDAICRNKKESTINVKDRIRELKLLMHKNHPDKGGDVDLFVEYSKELAEIRN